MAARYKMEKQRATCARNKTYLKSGTGAAFSLLISAFEPRQSHLSRMSQV